MSASSRPDDRRPDRIRITFDPEMAAGDGLYVVYVNDNPEPASHHQARHAAERWVRTVARINGYPEPIIEPEQL